MKKEAWESGKWKREEVWHNSQESEKKREETKRLFILFFQSNKRQALKQQKYETSSVKIQMDLQGSRLDMQDFSAYITDYYR